MIRGATGNGATNVSETRAGRAKAEELDAEGEGGFEDTASRLQSDTMSSDQEPTRTESGWSEAPALQLKCWSIDHDSVQNFLHAKHV